MEQIYCQYCDNQVKASDTHCYVCEAAITTEKRQNNIKIQSKVPDYDSERIVGNKAKTDLTKEEITTRKDSLKSSWTCPKCTYNNNLSDATCSICLQGNVDTHEPEKEFHGLVKELAKKLPTVSICTACQFHNKIGNTYCDSCQKTIEDNGVDTVHLPESRAPLTTLGHSWSCLHCSFINNLLALRCYACCENNQIFRPCTNCVACFIMNDHDCHCVDCRLIDFSPPTKAKNKEAGNILTNITSKFGSLIKPKKEPWYCRDMHCGFENKDKNKVCKQCNKDRGFLGGVD